MFLATYMNATKSREILKCMLSIMLILIFLFSIYLYIVGEWIAASFWMVATLSASFAVCAETSSMIVGALVGYIIFILAAFISHIVFLCNINEHIAFSAPDESEVVSDLSLQQLRHVFVSTNILGIVFSVLASIFIISILIFLVAAMKHHARKMERKYRGPLQSDPQEMQPKK